MIVKRFQNHVAESRIALPLTGVYAFWYVQQEDCLPINCGCSLACLPFPLS